MSSIGDENADRIGFRLNDVFRNIRNTEPEPRALLFHYTGASGLIGLVASKRLWASGADFLNDSSEPAYAIEVLNEALQILAADYRGSLAESWLENLFTEYIEPTYKREGPHIYVFCLSEHDDTLSQWRAYGTQCAGYALGFDGTNLKNGLRTGQSLLKVVYMREEQLKQATHNLKSILDYCISALPECRGDIKQMARSALYTEFIRLRAKFKHPAFREEGEWRVVHFQPPMRIALTDEVSSRLEQDLCILKVKHRAMASRVVPYVELDVVDTLVRQITYGATLNSSGVDQSLRRLTAGYSDIHITRSSIPYRI